MRENSLNRQSSVMITCLLSICLLMVLSYIGISNTKETYSVDNTYCDGTDIKFGNKCCPSGYGYYASGGSSGSGLCFKKSEYQGYKANIGGSCSSSKSFDIDNDCKQACGSSCRTSATIDGTPVYLCDIEVSDCYALPYDAKTYQCEPSGICGDENIIFCEDKSEYSCAVPADGMKFVYGCSYDVTGKNICSLNSVQCIGDKEMVNGECKCPTGTVEATDGSGYCLKYNCYYLKSSKKYVWTVGCNDCDVHNEYTDESSCLAANNTDGNGGTGGNGDTSDDKPSTPSSSSSNNTPSSSSNDTGNNNGNVENNPQTGSIAIFMVWIVALGTLAYAFWYFKKVRFE